MHTFYEQGPDDELELVHGPSTAEYDSQSSKDPVNYAHYN